MKRNFLPMMFALLGLLTAFSSVSSAQSFDPVFDWITHFRQGQDFEIGVRLKADTFTVFRKQITNIDKTTFDKLSTGSRQDYVGLKLKRDSQYLTFTMNDDLELEEQLSNGSASGSGSTLRTKTEVIPIETYPISRWGEFIQLAVNNGLLEYEDERFGGRDVENVALSFKPISLKSFPYGTKSLTFSDEFYEFMKFSEDYTPVAGSEGFVIIVHDPHWSRSGRFQLIPGLKALIDANKQNSYTFLVEGAFTDQSRTIGFSTLDHVIDRVRKTGPSEPLVYSLLSRYLIDSPLAYRLIYDRSLPSIAIDDPAFFKKGRKDAEIASRIKLLNAILEVEKVSQQVRLSDSDLKELEQLTSLAVAYALADVGQAGAQSLVAYHNDMARNLSSLSVAAKYLKQLDPTVRLDAEIVFLDSQIKAYTAEARVFNDALLRNTVMARLISAQAKWSTRRVPIAFIGNFHTNEITKVLRQQNIGYVVLEPRFSNLRSLKEREDFDRYIYPGTRESYIRDATGQDKGPVLPHITEVQKYYVPFIERESRNINNREVASERSYRELPVKEIDYGRFREAIRTNGVLSGAKIEFGGVGGGNEPPAVGGAFAYFEPADGGKEPKFVVLDPRDSRWNPKNSKARYNCLREMKLIPPAEEEGFTSLGKVTFYHDRESKAIFAGFFEPRSRRFYLVEGDKVENMLNHMTAPKPQKGKDMLIHMRLAELERLIQQRKERNGARRGRNEGSD